MLILQDCIFLMSVYTGQNQWNGVKCFFLFTNQICTRSILADEKTKVESILYLFTLTQLQNYHPSPKLITRVTMFLTSMSIGLYVTLTVLCPLNVMWQNTTHSTFYYCNSPTVILNLVRLQTKCLQVYIDLKVIHHHTHFHSN